MASFKKLNTRIYPKNAAAKGADYDYWWKLGKPVLVKEFGPIDYIDFSPVEPHYFAVTCSVRIQVYNPITKLVAKNLSRFKESAYGGSFRSDGKLICSGGEETAVKLFDVASKNLLRVFKGHTASIHRTFFIPDKPHIVSFSDDKCVKIWDVATEQQIVSFEEHTDYIRAGAVTGLLPDTVLSGGYDSVVKMYDTRTNAAVLTVNHGSPVESLLFFPSGGIFLSAGGTDIKVWDTIAGGKLLGSVSQHHKTITCLRMAKDNTRFMSGSLDRHVKIYDTSNFKVVHTLDYPNAVLSLGVSKDDSTVVAGLVDGLVCISRKEIEEVKAKPEKKAVTFRYRDHPSVDAIVPAYVKEKEAKYDHALRKFEYSKSLDLVLLPYVTNKNPHVTVTLLQELIRRKALHRALAGRESKSIIAILKFIQKNIVNYRFTRVLLNVFNIFLDVYEDTIPTMEAEIIRILSEISKVMKHESELQNELTKLHGSISMLLSAASIDEASAVDSTSNNLLPSADAQKNFIVNLT